MDYTTPSIKSKKVLFLFVLIFVLALLLGGFFWWRGEDNSNQLMGKVFDLGTLPNDFFAIDSSDGVILKNNNIGISFSVPKDWKFIGYLDAYIDLKSPEYEYDYKNFKRVSGCLVTVGSSKYDYSETRGLIEKIKKGSDYPENNYLIKVDGYDALKVLESGDNLSGENIENFINIRLPIGDFEVRFSTNIYFNDQECSQKFNELLATVSIGK